MQTRKTQNLIRNRVSRPESRYFLTCCAKRPQHRLTNPEPAQAVLGALDRMEADGNLTLLCSTVMPDHVHLLIRLGLTLSLDRVIAKFKSMTRGPLLRAGIEWQGNVYEHQLRVEESANSYALYIYLNPYRAGLIDKTQVWPHWHVRRAVDFDFLAGLRDGIYPRDAWLNDLPEQDLPRAEFVGSD